jgi:hypothetical protein
MLKGILLLFALGASPGDPPIKTAGWAKLYFSSDVATCQTELNAKADALNVIYANAKETSRWVGACVRAQ